MTYKKLPINRFITFEGGEGAGKSTQAKLLADLMNKAGHNAVLTREPGGGDNAEKIRNLIFSKQIDHWQIGTELLLMIAARIEHVNQFLYLKTPLTLLVQWVRFYLCQIN